MRFDKLICVACLLHACFCMGTETFNDGDWTDARAFLQVKGISTASGSTNRVGWCTPETFTAENLLFTVVTNGFKTKVLESGSATLVADDIQCSVCSNAEEAVLRMSYFATEGSSYAVLGKPPYSECSISLEEEMVVVTKSEAAFVSYQNLAGYIRQDTPGTIPAKTLLKAFIRAGIRRDDLP